MFNKSDVPAENKYAVLGIGLGGFYNKNYNVFMNFPSGDKDSGVLLSKDDVLSLIANTVEPQKLYIHDAVWITDDMVNLVNARTVEEFE